MIDLRKFFREANQMIVGGRLYYSMKERDYKVLLACEGDSLALKQALEEASFLESHPGSLVLVPVDLIKDAEEMMPG